MMNDNEPRLKSDISEFSEWAYDQGHAIEKGSIILGGVEQAFGFGLRQQYFHKSAMLVTDHNSEFTKGFILNRKSNSIVTDKYGCKWNVWFGGGYRNLNHPNPEIVCLHSMKGQDLFVDELSTTVMKGVHMCTFEKAQLLVDNNRANVSDFICIAGNTIWKNRQLPRELNQNSWVMCATDSQTIWKELGRLSKGDDKIDLGVDMWEVLMSMIGKGDTALECSGDFEDLILREWAEDNLSAADEDSDDDEGATMPLKIVDFATFSQHSDVKDLGSNENHKNVDVDVNMNVNVEVGTLLRASSDERSPYLLHDQVLHKALVLVILENDDASVGVILNQPSKVEVEMILRHPDTGQKASVYLPLRFGGPQSQEAVFWLHCDETLRDANVGSPIGSHDGFWKCTADDATAAVNCGIAWPSDFLVVGGLSAWPKNQNHDGMKGQVQNGNFECVQPSSIHDIFSHLQKQKVLKWDNMRDNLILGNHAWKRAGRVSSASTSTSIFTELEPSESIEENGIDANVNENVNDTDTHVPCEKKYLEKLSDDALKTWVATFLLGSPSLGA